MNKSELVFADAKNYKDIAEKRSESYLNVSKALDLVNEFIISKKKLLYGGMSIDLALKSMGHPGIYEETSIPDYDFLSSAFYDDSIELANMLADAGFENVSAINAIHFNSRRVRVNFVVVADITYVPADVLAHVPYLEFRTHGAKTGLKQYQGMRFVHPDFQRMDLLKAVICPFANPPQEAIFHRIEKDQKRFHLLNKYFPFHADLVLLQKIKADSAVTTLTVPVAYLNNAGITGIVAYALLKQQLERLVNGMAKRWLTDAGLGEFIREHLERMVPVTVEHAEDKWTINCSALLNAKNIVIFTDDYEQLVTQIQNGSKITKTEYFNRYLDYLRPRTVVLYGSDNNWEIQDTKGMLLSAFPLAKIQSVSAKLGGDPTNRRHTYNPKVKFGGAEDVYLASPCLVMLYYLQRILTEKDETQKKIYMLFYTSLAMIIEIAEKVVLAMQQDAEGQALLKKVYCYLPFFLTYFTYGKYNWSVDHVAYMLERKSILQKEPLHLRPPFSYYPDTSREKQEFTPTNEFFLIDGSLRIRPFTPLTIDLDKK